MTSPQDEHLEDWGGEKTNCLMSLPPTLENLGHVSEVEGVVAFLGRWQ